MLDNLLRLNSVCISNKNRSNTRYTGARSIYSIYNLFLLSGSRDSLPIRGLGCYSQPPPSIQSWLNRRSCSCLLSVRTV
ncbi:unnamed protein product [Rhizophagus irregularis]|uniref:Uncharacterized protein n=1 Tax=Rhizophagus irregularis TaxID=588596 RepID=A0A916DYT2_9GLOM|nr:unnamed protein product [Rhizophagus irregularis]CAB5310655.1 unnamed protein product [Rhizophagus irregularis]